MAPGSALHTPWGVATGVQVLTDCVRCHLPEGETEAQGVGRAGSWEGVARLPRQDRVRVWLWSATGVAPVPGPDVQGRWPPPLSLLK